MQSAGANTPTPPKTQNPTPAAPTDQHPDTLLTRNVGGDFSESRLAKALGSTSPDRDQVGSARMQVGEHMVRLIPQLGYGAPRARNVDAGIGGFDALVANL